jgi:hypothetical protein
MAMARRMVGAVLAACAILAGCADAKKADAVAPPRATDPIAIPATESSIAADVGIDLADIERELERSIPRRLWAINRQDMQCVPSKKVDLKLFSVKSPTIKCDVTGEVLRGKIRVSGRGRDLIATVPIRGTLVARDIGGILKSETASGTANVVLDLKLDLSPDWTLRADAKLNYAWAKEPGINFLGQRIRLTSAADKELQPLVGQVERTLERQLARTPIRAAAERGWKEAHTVLELNADNPSVWARLVPRQFRFGGYRVEGKRVTLSLGLDGQIETIVGHKPEAASPGPLPALGRLEGERNAATLSIPVAADYAVLEPVIAKALAKRAQRPFAVRDFGTVKVNFQKVQVYGASGNRIAVGVTFDAKSNLKLLDKADGTIWLIARPVNQPNSREIAFTDAAITGQTDIVGGDLLLAFANDPEFKRTITEALKQNFENDFTKLRSKIDLAVQRRTDGPLSYEVKIDRLETGQIVAHGQGLFLPVEMHAAIRADLVRIK